jgi:tetratricopeptide (TPR) repeat protein
MIPLGWARSEPNVIPAAIGLVLLLVMAATEGGYQPTTWYPVTLGALALLVMTVLALGVPRGVPRATLAAAALLALFVCWGFLSMTWADQQGLAWDGANRAGLYLVVFLLFALWPLSGGAAAVLVAIFGLGVAGIGLVELLRVAAADDPSQFFVSARLAEPVGYMNANAALWALALWPCAVLASRRELHPLLRGAFLASAGLLASLSLMSQSRAWILALPVGAIAVLALVPGRVRTAVALVATAAATAAVAGPVIAVHDDAGAANFAVLVADARDGILIAVLALAVAGVAWGLVDRRVEPTPARLRAARAGGAVAAVLAVVAAAAILFAAVGDPIGEATDAWDEFKRGGSGPAQGASRLSSTETNRYDFWSVAWELFRDEPVHGIGMENFQAEYLKRGESGEQPRFAHSLELGVLSQTGIVGALLLGGAFFAALAAGISARRRATGVGAAAGAAALATFAYWLAHASVDWLWEFAALGGSALAMLGLAGALRSSAGEQARAAPRGQPRHGLVVVLVALVPALALAVSVALPWLAERNVQSAAEEWRSDPAEAFRLLDRAADLDPLSPTPQLTAGTIALELNRPRAAERHFRDALERDPESFYAVLELGAIAAVRGESRPALTLLRRARALNPTDAVAREALSRARSGDPMPLTELSAAIRAQAEQRVQ